MSAVISKSMRSAVLRSGSTARPTSLCNPSPSRAAPSELSSRMERVVRRIQVGGPAPTGGHGHDKQSVAPTNVTIELINSMSEKIKAALETEKVNIVDAYGDAQHVSIDVVSPLFEGKNQMQRQRMVYKAIWEELQSAVHAVDAMTTKTPEEAAK